ncbi:uncharacterized protein LOC127103232 [Lathyrus oleraceus]|uniref:uncharacterized protein LOC127103232 n=1 Tax=Pisum sativum TaxID=3888 RepID=UPI0021D18574|nr:uncharacterized protein LOC127103232 [Pisum sativum]
MESSKRNIYSFKFKDPDLRSLRDLVSQMHPVYRINFGKYYGNLLSILNQRVDYTTLITLAQFHDLPLRCFTFQDFQLAPTLEEFERLVRIPMKNKPLFEGIDESLPLEIIASTLHMDEKEVEANLETKGSTKGFSLGFLLERAHTLIKAESWDACYSAIALAIYGVVLFPNMDGFVDMAVICVFLTGNLVPTLLADVYYYISHRYTKKKGMIACCAPLLYQWFLEHLPKTGAWVEQTDVSWPQRLGSLRSEDLSWYSKEYINMDIVFSSGDFPNLPLIRTQGCVNANPVLSLRQLGYPMEGPPEAGSLEAFLLLDFGVENTSLFQRIKEAWKNFNRKGKADLGRANGITKEPYFHWERDYVIEDYESFKKTIDFLQGDKDTFRAKLDGLVGFCNWAAKELPWKLRDAVEELKEDSTPPAIISFILLCKGLLKRFNKN